MPKLQTLKPPAGHGMQQIDSHAAALMEDRQAEYHPARLHVQSAASEGRLPRITSVLCVLCLREMGITTQYTHEQLAQLAAKGISRLPFTSVVDHIESHLGKMARFGTRRIGKVCVPPTTVRTSSKRSKKS